MIDDLVIMALDVLGIVALAAGATALAYPYVGWGGLVVGGLVLIGGARLAEFFSHGTFRRE